MQLRWRVEALLELDQIRDFIGQDNPVAAERVAEKIRATPRRLKAHPYIGREGRVPGTREVVVLGLPYVLAYEIVDDRIEILAVRHTSRRWPETFRSSP